MVQAKLTFYGINECGYFAREGGGAPAFGNGEMLMDEFFRWAKDGQKTLAETCTYHPKEGSHLLRTFCYDCLRNERTGDYLLVTWNETPTFEGGVAHVSENERVGNVSVSTVEVPDHAIPGFATYFLFLPREGAYATIRFESLLNGNAGLQKLLKEFLAKFTTHCVHDEERLEAGQIRVLGYRASDDDEVLHLYPRFSSSLLRQPAMLDYIRGSRERITKIHRKNLLISGHPENDGDAELRVFTQLFRALGGIPEESRGDIPVTYEMQLTPTETELNGIIGNWNRDIAQDRTSWEDVGFQLSGEQKIYWLSSSLIKEEPQLDVTPDGNEIVDTEELFQALQAVRPSLIRAIHQRNHGRRRE